MWDVGRGTWDGLYRQDHDGVRNGTKIKARMETYTDGPASKTHYLPSICMYVLTVMLGDLS